MASTTPRRFPIRACLAACVVIAAAASPHARADTIVLRPYLRAERLAEIEAALAPAKPFVRTPANNPTPVIRGWVVGVEPDPLAEAWTIEVRAWWRATDTSPLERSRGTAKISSREIQHVTFDGDSVYGLEFWLGARDSNAMFDDRLRAYDPDGRLGLAIGTVAGPVASASAANGAVLRWQQYQRDAVARALGGPEPPPLPRLLEWQIDRRPELILEGLAFDAAYGPFEPGYRDEAFGALAFLALLVRTSVRAEFFQPPAEGRPAAADIPASERFAGFVYGLGFRAQEAVFQALHYGTWSTPFAERQPEPLHIEPSDYSYAALEAIAALPTLALPDSQAGDTVAHTYFRSLVEIGAPTWVPKPPTPPERLGDRLQHGAEGRLAGFVAQRGSWTQVQIAARNAALKLLLPDFDNPVVDRYGLAAALQDAAALHQRAFCELVGADVEQGLTHFVERTYIEAMKNGRPIDVPCLESLLNPGSDMDLERARQRGVALLPTLLIVGAIVSHLSPQPLVPDTELGRLFDGTLEQWLELSDLPTTRVLQTLTTAGGYVFPDRDHYDAALARAAVGRAVQRARDAIRDGDGDAAHLTIRDLAERAVAATPFAPNPYEVIR